MKRLLKLECPNCHATLSFTERRELMFCEYCGAKIELDNDNENIYRKIDEADVKRAETEQLVKLKELELAKQVMDDKKRLTKIMIVISIVMGLIGTILFLIGIILDNDSFGIIGLLLYFVIFMMWIFIPLSKE